MKKLLSTFLIAATLTMAVPAKKAEAGVFLIVTGGTGAVVLGTTTALLFGGTGTAVLALDGYATTHGAVGWTSLLGGLVALDENEVKRDGIVLTSLRKNYPQIENQQVLEELAQEITFEAGEMVEGRNYVALPENNVREILESANLSEELTEKIVTELI